MKRITPTWKALFVLSFFFPLSNILIAQTDDAKVKEEIMQVNKKFEQVFNTSGGIGVAAFYAKDAIALPPNSDMIRDNDGIGKFWKSVFDAGVKRFSLEALTVQTLGDGAVETGKFTIYDANEKQIDTGKYVVFWKKEKDEWKLFRDIWNSSLPAKH